MHGVCRWRTSLDHILNAYVGAGLKNTPDDTRRVLEVALYQLLFLDRIPVHAVVDSAVNGLRSKKARGFVNAVLRTVLRELRRLEAEDQPEPGPSLFAPGSRRWHFDRAVLSRPEARPTRLRGLDPRV